MPARFDPIREWIRFFVHVREAALEEEDSQSAFSMRYFSMSTMRKHMNNEKPAPA